MLSEKEQLVLSNVRNNSRKSLADISRETAIPVTTAFDILKRLKSRKIVDRYVTLVDFPKLGYTVRANLALKFKKKEEVLSALVKNSNVNSILRMAGGLDYFIDVVFENFSQFEFFKESMERFGIVKMKEHHIVEEIKREGASFS